MKRFYVPIKKNIEMKAPAKFKQQSNKYIENRAWFSCCRLNLEKLPTLKDLSFLNEVGNKLTILNFQNLTFSNEVKYIFDYEELEYIEIELNNKGIREFNERFITNSNKLFSLKIKIFDNGLVNTLCYFDLFNCNDLNSLNIEEYKLFSVINNISKDMEILFNSFIVNKYLIKTKYFYWGIPEFAKYNEITIASSYLYQCNYFIPDKELYNKLTLNIDLEERKFQYKDLNCCLLPSEAHLLWTGKFEKDRYDYLSIPFILTAESSVYSTALVIASFILRIINSKHSSLDNQFRHIFNYINEVLLSIRYTSFTKDFCDRNFSSFMLKFWDLKNGYELFKDTEQRLKYAIDSIEVKKNQNNNRFIQNILAVFTGLTMFSVLNDIFSFLSNDKLVESTFIILKTSLLLIIFISVNLALFMINKRTNGK